MEEKTSSATEIVQKNGNAPKRKPTIGIIINTIEQTARHINGHKIWLGVMDAAKEQDVNIVYFHVDFMSKKPPQDTAKVLYELIDAQNVDGLISFLYWDREKFDKYCSRFSSSIPIVNIRRDFDGFPTVIQDDYQGMRDVMSHLVEEHGYKRIVYLQGEEENKPNQNRYRAYLDALAAYDLPYNADLVTSWGINKAEMGKEAVRELMDERNLKPGNDFDAIALTNDRRGFGVLEALEERGVRVPYDVGVIGFDDIAGTEFTIPPLATVSLRYYEMGKQAANTLFAIMDGTKKDADLVLIPPKLVARESCGCLPADVRQAGVRTTRPPQTELETVLATHREDVIDAMIHSTVENKTAVAWAGQVFDAFVLEVTGGPSGGFLEKIDEALRPMMSRNDNVFVWQTAISNMRSHLHPYLWGEQGLLADDLWQQASVLIGKMALRTQGYKVLLQNDQADLLRKVSTGFVTLFDIDQLMDRLAEDLPKLGISRAFLSLYDDSEVPGGNARLMLALTKQGHAQEYEGLHFPSPQLAPKNLLWQEDSSNFVVESLHFRDKPIGFVAFEVGPLDGNIYSSLGREISSALQGALLVKLGQRRAAQLQASVEVAQTLSRILDPEQLTQEVVELICEKFDLYFVGLFLMIEERPHDPKPKKYAVLRAATGDAGQEMIANGHRLEAGGNSMIGQCVATGEACIALDVGKAPVHFANPLLPETHSELALPLISRGETIGALGLQSTQKGAFDEEDAAIFQTMASQLASAIENASLFSQADEARNKLEAELSMHVREGWNRYLSRRK